MKKKKKIREKGKVHKDCGGHKERAGMWNANP